MIRTASRGFTLLEVMVAGGMLVFVTAAAMASYVAQLQLTNSQQQSTTATDEVREALRLIGNDLRSAAPGMNAGLLSGGATGTGGAANSQLACPVGTVPYSSSSFSAVAPPIPLICIPPIFRSTSPLAQLAGGLTNNPNQGKCVSATSPGFTLSFPNGFVEPDPGGALFCPDDLVILAVDDSNPFFVSGLPPSSIPVISGGAAADPRLLFLPPPTLPAADVVAQSGLDQDGIQAVTGNPFMLISGAGGPVLIDQPPLVGGTTPYPAGTTGAGLNFASVPVKLGGTLTDVFGSAGTGYPVAMPARLVQYSIQPINATGGTAPPFVTANLVRTEVTPMVAGPGTPPLYFAQSFSTILVKGVLDMQVEFGLDPNGTGQLQYVNSGGFQSVPQLEPDAPAAPVAPPSAETTILHVSSTCLTNGVNPAPPNPLFPGTCFPVGGMQYVRSVRLNLLVRTGNSANTNATNGQVQRSAAVAQAAPFNLQPAVQDLSPKGNLEAQNWGWTFSNTWAHPAAPNSTVAPCLGGCNGYPSIDAASYREVSTEIFVRNLGLTNNF